MGVAAQPVFNTTLFKERVPNFAAAARRIGLRPATVSDLCRGKTPVGEAKFKTLKALADLAGCSVDDLVIMPPERESFADSIRRWAASADGTYVVGGPRVDTPISLEDSARVLEHLPEVGGDRPISPKLIGPYAI